MQPNQPNLDQLDRLEQLDQLKQLESSMTDHHYELEETVLKLSDYLKTVEVVVKETFAHHVWVKAEIRNLSSKSGHYYFELAEKDDSGKIIASCRGNLWRFQAERTLKKFAQSTGMQLTRDLTVMLKVTANMHPQYGFSLTIVDIDPNYTIGDLARQYTAMLDRLTGEGLTELNKSCPVPLDIQNVIVIAPEKAAGLGDFRAEADHLQAYGACQFHYHYATFQGNHAPKEIRHAITDSMKRFESKHHCLPDLMVVIRGGGAVGDLGYLNDYELAALLAEQPIAVWVGIGHERDRVILDEVAHSSFDTPSKVINAIVHHQRTMAETAQGYMDSIERLSKQQLQLVQANTQRLLNQVQAKSISQLTKVQQDSEHAMQSIQRTAHRQLKQAQQQSNQQLQKIQRDSRQQIKQATISISHYVDSIRQQAGNQLKQANELTEQYYQQNKGLAYQSMTQAKKDSEHLREIILLQNPRNVLQQGYAMIKDDNGQILTSATQLQPQQTIHIEMRDGEVLANVERQVNLQ